jgi:hypothetical protein
MQPAMDARTAENSDASLEVNDKFVACIEVVNKIKMLSSLKDKMGKVPHSYTVAPDNKWKGYERQSSEVMAGPKSNLTTQEAYRTNEDSNQGQLDMSKAVVKVNRKKLSNETNKDKAFRLRNSNPISSSRSNLIGQQLAITSMIHVKDPMICTAERSMISLKKSKILEPMMLPQTEHEDNESIHDTVEYLKKSFNMRMPGHRELGMSDGSKTERGIYSRGSQFRGIEVINENFEQLIRDKHKVRDSRTQLGTRRSKGMRKSFLIKVDQTNQIDKSSLFVLSNNQLRDRTFVKMGNLITEKNYNLFEPFLKNFERLSSIFPQFRVKGLQDYTVNPLEDFDTELDPTIDIEYMLKRNNSAKSRWAEKDGSISWRDCTIKSYDNSTKQFRIEWGDSDHVTIKTVTRMNLLLPGDDPNDIERRRVASNVVRCMYLLEDSLRQSLLTKEMLDKCKLYFSYRNFKTIIENSKIDIHTFNQSDFLCSFLLEVLDEYAVEVLKFYVGYKTAEDYDSFVEVCE